MKTCEVEGIWFDCMKSGFAFQWFPAVELGLDSVLVNFVSGLICSAGYIQWELRPRGELKRSIRSSLRVARSRVIPSELGLFASEFIPARTELGKYPGVVVNSTLWIQTKYKIAKQSKDYVWNLESGLIIDPTGFFGNINPYVSDIFGVYRIPTDLARINEPNPGQPPNVYAFEHHDCVVFETLKDIQPNQDGTLPELLIDYGPFYDRSQYKNT
mmetsp:Transcript_11398/g.20614  ORF Transcript_11398/g.20614 Transcript_11398/m.20614 type:complete len:214 (-) Transcript_11398:1736-2377(-)